MFCRYYFLHHQKSNWIVSFGTLNHKLSFVVAYSQKLHSVTVWAEHSIVKNFPKLLIRHLKIPLDFETLRIATLTPILNLTLIYFYLFFFGLGFCVRPNIFLKAEAECVGNVISNIHAVSHCTITRAWWLLHLLCVIVSFDCC